MRFSQLPHQSAYLTKLGFVSVAHAEITPVPLAHEDGRGNIRDRDVAAVAEIAAETPETEGLSVPCCGLSHAISERRRSRQLAALQATSPRAAAACICSGASARSRCDRSRWRRVSRMSTAIDKADDRRRQAAELQKKLKRGVA